MINEVSLLEGRAQGGVILRTPSKRALGIGKSGSKREDIKGGFSTTRALLE